MEYRMILTGRQRHISFRILFSALCSFKALGQSPQPLEEGDLRAVVVLMRHGVRAPIESETRSNAYNSQPWPATRDPRGESPVTLGADFAENFLLQYTEGMPMSQVGWGRVPRPELNDLMEMNTRYHDFMLRTPYGAQVAASNLAAHICDTIFSAGSGKTTPYQLGTTDDHFILLDGHDSNLSWLGCLLRLDWVLPDQTFNATPPGNALVFEIRRNRTTGATTVQVFFISQTLDQIREFHTLTAAEQPSIAPVFVPGCSGPAPTFACSVEEFARVVDSAIDNRFVVASPK
jgi:4-phytase / acid phosphatase